jgi:hypothetical protein
MSDEAPPKASKGGRPRVPDPGATVSTWVPASDYDKIIKAAKAQDVTISALVRLWLKHKIR